MFKRISDWLGKRPQTKASYIGATANVIMALVNVGALIVNIYLVRLNYRVAIGAETEQVRIVFRGGLVCEDDYQTQFDVSRAANEIEKVILPTRWPVVLTNTGQTVVSIVTHSARAVLRGENRNIKTSLLGEDGKPIDLPIVISPGVAVRAFLGVPVRIRPDIYRAVVKSHGVGTRFTPGQLQRYLLRNYSGDIYGNRWHTIEKRAGQGPDKLLAPAFEVDAAGRLTSRLNQADQVTVEFQSARGSVFSARTFYYEEGASLSVRVPKDWEHVEISLRSEPLDTFPILGDANDPSE
jgi:hypothetical protein